MLGEKNFGNDVKIENCSLRLKLSIKKSNFWKFSFLSSSSELWTNIYRGWRKVLCRDIKIGNCTLCLQSIMLRLKINFENFVSFPFIRTWNIIVLDLRQQSFHPVCQKCNLRVQMNCLRDVGIRSDITWSETFFEPWRKNFDLFLKTAFYVPKGTFWVKKIFFESSVFFETLRNFERTFTVLGDKEFGRAIKIEKCSFRLIRSIGKSNFWKVSFFKQTLQNFERTFTVLGEKVLGRDIKIENCTLCLQSIMLGIKITLENFVSFLFIRTWNIIFWICGNRVFTRIVKNALYVSNWNLFELLVLEVKKFKKKFFLKFGEKIFGRDIRIENCSLRLIRLIKKSNFWKFSFLSIFSEIWTYIYRAWRKSYGQGYQTWKLYSKSSEYHAVDENNF